MKPWRGLHVRGRWHRAQWHVIEQFGRVHVLECRRCGRSRIAID